MTSVLYKDCKCTPDNHEKSGETVVITVPHCSFWDCELSWVAWVSSTYEMGAHVDKTGESTGSVDELDGEDEVIVLATGRKMAPCTPDTITSRDRSHNYRKAQFLRRKIQVEMGGQEIIYGKEFDNGKCA